jgi:hypothetical protein
LERRKHEFSVSTPQHASPTSSVTWYICYTVRLSFRSSTTLLLQPLLENALGRRSDKGCTLLSSTRLHMFSRDMPHMLYRSTQHSKLYNFAFATTTQKCRWNEIRWLFVSDLRKCTMLLKKENDCVKCIEMCRTSSNSMRYSCTYCKHALEWTSPKQRAMHVMRRE